MTLAPLRGRGLWTPGLWSLDSGFWTLENHLYSYVSYRLVYGRGSNRPTIATRWIGFTLGLAAIVVPAFGRAQSPVQREAGFYRFKLGAFEIVTLNDCTIPYPTSTIVGLAPAQIDSGLAEWSLASPVGMTYSAFLVNTGTMVVLIDAGTGGKMSDNPGFHGCDQMLINMRRAGYDPARVDEIYISHIGPDHVGGLTTGTERTFPNAIVRAADDEIGEYIDSARARAAIDRASDRKAEQEWFDFQRSLFEPYRRAGRVRTFTGDVDLVPGVRALATHGHSPGHTSYIVASRGDTLIMTGDLLHWAAVQFAHPEASTVFDSDQQAAATQRKRVLEIAAKHGYWIAGSHLPFPGIGHVKAANGRYYWVPLST